MFPDTTRAYDRAITVFSPDGRLLQVEYAVTATRRTPLAMGAKCQEGVVLMARRSASPLLTLPEKISKIDDHLGAIAAGIVGDGIVLVDRSRLEAQSYRLIYNESVDVANLAKKIALFEQSYTQYAGVRPFGVVMIFGGVGDKPSLYVTHPGGAYYSYSAVAMGRDSDAANEFLRKNYKENVSIREVIELLLGQITKVSEEKITTNDIEAAVVSTKTKKFAFMSKEELEQAITAVYEREEKTV